MRTCKITYNGNEISAVDEAAPVSVAYNSATIATLNDGDTKTLGCNGKVMASDVVVGSKTLNCNGKLMQGDIVVELVGSATSSETWYFNDRIGMPDTDTLDVNFTSNGAAYTRIYLYSITSPLIMNLLRYDNADSGSIQAVHNYMNHTWVDEAYRTIVLNEPATGDVIAFLEGNATKIT